MSWRKISFAAAILVGAWFLFGNVAPASAAGLSCYWTASSSQNMSDPTNWYDSALADGSPCSNVVGAGLQLRSDYLSPEATSTNAIWDTGLTTTLSVAIDVTYNGVVSIGEANATTSYFYQAGGTVSTTGSGVFRVGGSFIINGNAKWAGLTGMNVVLYGDDATLTISTTSVDFYNLVIDGSYTSNGTNFVIVNNDITVNSGKSLILSAINNELIVDGNFYNSGTVTQSNASYTIMRSGQGVTLGGSGVTTLYNLTLTSSTVTLAGNIDIDSNISIDENSTLDLAAYDLDLACNLDNSGTVTQTSGTVSMTDESANYTLGGTGDTTFYNLTTTGVTTTLAGNLTVTNVLTVDTDTEFDAATYTLVLSGSGTPLVNNGIFSSSASNVQYTSTGAVTSTAETYYDLVFGTGTYFFSDSATSSNSFINSGTTTIWADKYLYAPVTFDNNGTITENGAIKHPATSVKLTNSAGTEVSTFTSADSVYVTVEDHDGNLSNTVADTISGSLITASPYSDSEAITLTETGVDTGIFRSSALPLVVTAGALSNNGQLNVSGDHSLSLAFVDSKESADTDTDTANYSVSAYSGGGGGSSSGSSYVAPVAETTTETVTETTTETVAETTTETVTETTTETVAETTTETPITPVVTTNVTAQFNNYLGVGSQGEEVKQLQQLLKDLGYYTYSSITGYFGNITKAAVVKFQQAQGFSSFPGHIGPLTRIALNKLTKPVTEEVVVEETPAVAVVTPTGYQFKNYLYIGSRGEAVTQLQQLLKDLGYFTYPTITGYFGNVTKAAVVKFQQDKNLSPYPGWLGPLTRAALNELVQ